MTSFKLYKPNWLIVSILALLPFLSHAQFEWNWKDPVDVGSFDLGDNKLLLYNAIGVTLVHFLAKEKTNIKTANSFRTISAYWYKEYRKANRPTILDIKYKVGKHWKKRIWIGTEGNLYIINDYRTIGGVGFSPFFTWNLINSQFIRISFDNGVGPVYFFESFPQGGTKFNFSTTYGIEVEVKTDRFNYSIGGRNTHFSNAFIAGKDKNPGFDGVGVYFSVRW